MQVNWRVRVNNKAWWLSMVPAVLLLAQVVATPFGYDWELDVLGEQLTDIVNAVFAVLTLLGVVADPTTEGMSDSVKAMGYEAPAPSLSTQREDQDA